MWGGGWGGGPRILRFLWTITFGSRLRRSAGPDPEVPIDYYFRRAQGRRPPTPLSDLSRTAQPGFLLTITFDKPKGGDPPPPTPPLWICRTSSGDGSYALLLLGTTDLQLRPFRDCWSRDRGVGGGRFLWPITLVPIDHYFRGPSQRFSFGGVGGGGSKGSYGLLLSWLPGTGGGGRKGGFLSITAVFNL